MRKLQKADGSPCYVAPEAVAAIAEVGDTSAIYLATGASLRVKGKAAEVEAALFGFGDEGEQSR